MATSIYDVDFAGLAFDAPRREKSGQTVIPMNYSPGDSRVETFYPVDRLCVQLGRNQTEMVTTPFGLGTPIDGSVDAPRRNVEILVSHELENKLRELDTIITQKAIEMCQEWFGKATLTKEHQPIVRIKPNGSFYVRIKVDMRTTSVKVLTARGAVASNVEAITPNSKLLMVVDTPGIWYSPTQFGLSFTARGVLVTQPVSARTGLDMFTLLPGIVDADPDANDDDADTA